MAFIPAANTARVIMGYRFDNQRVQNNYWVRREAGWSAEQLEEVATIFKDWFVDLLSDSLTNEFHLDYVQARDYSVEEGNAVEIQVVPAASGALVNAGLPGNAALAVKILTGLAGRSRRGRVFMAGISEQNAAGNVVTEAFRDAMVTAHQTLQTTLDAAGYQMVVASFYHGTALTVMPNGETRRMPVPRGAAVLTPVLGFAADLNLDSQRRRLNGRGI